MNFIALSLGSLKKRQCNGLLYFYDILKQVTWGHNIVEDGWASPFPHTHTQKASKTLVFLPFDWCSQTYWQTDGQSLLKSCVSATKKIPMFLPFVCFKFCGFNITPDKRSRWQKYETRPDTRPYQLWMGGQGRKCAVSHFSTHAHRRTKWRTDGWTKALIELRVRN